MATDFLNIRIPLPVDVDHNTVFASPEYRRFWAFLYKYGEKHTFDGRIDAMLGEKLMNGKCIGHAQLDTNTFNEQNIHEEYPVSFAMYTEGLANFVPLILHAWSSVHTNRHSFVYDSVWHTNGMPAKDVWYQGVCFDQDVVKYIRSQQHRNKDQTLPYLSKGCCCLTYKPLLEGKLAEYPLVESDIEASLDSLYAFLLSLDILPDLKVWDSLGP